MRGFIKNLLYVSTGITILVLILGLFRFYDPYFFFSLISIAFLTLLSLLVYFIMWNGISDQNKNRFIAYFGIGLSLKFMLSLAFLALMLLAVDGFERMNVIPFMFMYMVYTVFVSLRITGKLSLYPQNSDGRD